VSTGVAKTPSAIANLAAPLRMATVEHVPDEISAGPGTPAANAANAGFLAPIKSFRPLLQRVQRLVGATFAPMRRVLEAGITKPSPLSGALKGAAAALPLLLALGCGDDGGGDAAEATSSSTTMSSGGTATGNVPGSSGSTSTGTPASSSETSSADSSSTGSSQAPPYEARGPYGVGLQTSTVMAGKRELEATVWYPSDSETGSTPLSDLVPDGQQDVLQGLIDDAPPECVRATAEGTLDADVAQGTFPVVMVSHCYSCLGLSSGFIAERLASHGMIVVGVTHTGGSLFDSVAGNPGPLDGEFLQTRSEDVINTFDAVSETGELAASMDTSRLGVFGHSFGATTTGLVLQNDDRFSAGVAIAAPIQNPLLPGVDTAQVAEPMLYLLMEEDNSILTIGNNLLRSNAMGMPGGSWLVELADAGHWSPSDLCGIVEDFMPGCGDGLRQTDGTPFSYLSADEGRNITASYVTAFFALHLQDDASAADYLDVGTPSDTVTVTRFPAR